MGKICVVCSQMALKLYQCVCFLLHIIRPLFTIIAETQEWINLIKAGGANCLIDRILGGGGCCPGNLYLRYLHAG